MGIGTRIKKLRAVRDMSGYALAKAAGMTATHVKAIEDGATEEPRGRTVEKLARALGVTPAELREEDAEPPSPSPGADHDAPRPEHAVAVPLRAVSSGGPPVDSEDLGEVYSILHHLYRPERYVIRLAGDSMFPTFHDGDLLLVEPVGKVGENTPAIVRIGNETTVKRVSKRKGGGFFLRADNPLYRPLETDAGEAEVKGRIVCIVEGKRP